MLDCSLLLLENSGLLHQVRGNPIAVVRKISQMVSSFIYLLRKYYLIFLLTGIGTD